MRTDLWGWFNRFAMQASIEGNLQKQHLVYLYDKGWQSLRAEKHAEALNYFEEGSTLSGQLNLPCFELFYDYWSAETLVFYKNDYREGLDRSIKMGARAHKEQFADCPVRGRVYYTLMYVYYAMDASGYEDKIREMIDFMDKEIPLDDDTYQRMLYTQSSLAYTLENYDEAKTIIQQYLALTVGNAHRQSGGYNMLRMLAHAHGHLEEALNFARICEKYARFSRLENSVALSLLWQAVYAQYTGNSDDASALHIQGKSHYERFDLKPLPEYYNAVCEYLELCGDIEAVLDLRREELKAIPDVGSVSYTANSWLQYVRLLGRAGEDMSDALLKVAESAKPLLKPQRFTDKLKKIESGEYYEFDWQQQHR